MASTGINASLANLRLWQLISPSLPIGGYAYSTGLEAAIEAGWIVDELTLESWIDGVLTHGLGRLDLPLFFHARAAWGDGEAVAIKNLLRFAMAMRESSELQAEDRYLGQALARVLHGFGIEQAAGWENEADCGFMAMFSLAVGYFDIEPGIAAQGAAWVWCENQVIAALKLMSLGQTAGQRILFGLAGKIPGVVNSAQKIGVNDMGMLLPGLAIASAWHETQGTRLFRS